MAMLDYISSKWPRTKGEIDNHGIARGLLQRWHKSGRPCIYGWYNNSGERHGIYKRWHNNGKLQWVGMYLNNVDISEQIFNEYNLKSLADIPAGVELVLRLRYDINSVTHEVYMPKSYMHYKSRVINYIKRLLPGIKHD